MKAVQFLENKWEAINYLEIAAEYTADSHTV